MFTNYKIDAKEVLLYLNQLGYTNISAHTLKEFLTDLKKLLKNSVKQQIHLSDSFNDYTPIRNENLYQTSRCDFPNTKERLQTKNSFQEFKGYTNKQEVPSSNVRQISLHLLRNIGRNPHGHCIHIDDVHGDVIKSVETDQKAKSEESKSFGELATVESTSKTTVSSAKQSSKSTSGRQRGGKSKSIKPINRRDPVALYHYYQSEWNKVKFPGEEEHAALRRTVRKKMSDNKISKKF